MASVSKAEFERAVWTPAARRGYSGSPARLELRWTNYFPNAIGAIKALRECGLTLKDAKDKIEEDMAKRVIVGDLPFVADVDALIACIGTTGATAKQVTPVSAE